MLNSRFRVPMLIHRDVKEVCLLASSLHTLAAVI
jgi:hypothetical protein